MHDADRNGVTHARPKRVVLLGATGSIGTSALRVIRAYPDALELVGISAHSNAEQLAAIQQEFKVPHVALSDATAYSRARREGIFTDCRLHGGCEGIEILATLDEADLVLIALVGTAGLNPTLKAIAAGKAIALANKEVLVMAGKFVTEAARQHGTTILPVDSEHNALFQCAQAAQQPKRDIARIILTASGGPFRDRPLDTFGRITLQEALSHPNWNMGPKVTLDSATMANKGLELIEAKWLFDMPAERLEVTIHAQSIVHSMVEMRDGSVLGLLTPPSMTFPIQHVLLYPERRPPVVPSLSFREALDLSFRPVCYQRYPLLGLAYAAMRQGGTAETVFNAANEVAVAAFVRGEIAFPSIAHVTEFALEKASLTDPSGLEVVYSADAEARRLATQALNTPLCSLN